MFAAADFDGAELNIGVAGCFGASKVVANSEGFAGVDEVPIDCSLLLLACVGMFEVDAVGCVTRDGVNGVKPPNVGLASVVLLTWVCSDVAVKVWDDDESGLSAGDILSKRLLPDELEVDAFCELGSLRGSCLAGPPKSLVLGVDLFASGRRKEPVSFSGSGFDKLSKTLFTGAGEATSCV